MGNFRRSSGRDFGGRDRDSRSGRDSGRRDSDRDSRSGRDFGGGRSRPRAEMHPATCDECGNECEVPFKPTSSKPIYCSDCFKKKESGSRNNNSEELNQINAKLDKIMAALKISE